MTPNPLQVDKDALTKEALELLHLIPDGYIPFLVGRLHVEKGMGL